MERKNLAVELLRKLLQGEITKRRKQNVVQARSFFGDAGRGIKEVSQSGD